MSLTRNVGVRGRVVGPTGEPRSGVLVEATDGEKFLGRSVTDVFGTYEISWTTSNYASLTHWRPDIVVSALDARGVRVAASTPALQNVTTLVADAPDLIVRDAELSGWLVTQGRGAPARVTHGNALEPLVDGEACFGAVLDLVRRARHSLCLQQLYFKPEFRLAHDPPATLVGELGDAARRGVVVRVLLNENALAPDDVSAIREAFQREGPEDRIRLRSFVSSPEVVHPKLVLADGAEAIVVGSPFEPRWWDTTLHGIDDARRGRGQPMHDVSARVRGPVVGELGGLFAQLWNHAASDEGDHIGAPPPLPRAGDQMIQVACTFPDALFGGERGIAEMYERAFALAEDFVYLETQYMTSRTVFRALRAALDARPALEAILLVNETMDAPPYGPAQDRGLAQLGFPEDPRVGVFTAYATHRSLATLRAQPIYLHSKVGIVDDAWATLGSANLDGYSLDSADELALHGVRCVETNLSVLDGIEGAPRTGTVARLRAQIWAEHLGLRVQDVEARPPGGWLKLWRDTARRSLEDLAAGAAPRARALPLGAPLPPRVKRLPHDVNVFNKPRQ